MSKEINRTVYFVVYYKIVHKITVSYTVLSRNMLTQLDFVIKNYQLSDNRKKRLLMCKGAERYFCQH